MAGRKRVRAPSATRWGAKKRRTIRKKRFARRRQNKDISTRTLNAVRTPNQLSGRLLSKRAYRSKLWEATRFHTKFKAAFSKSNAISTPATFNSLNWGQVQVFDNSVPFWTSAGGLNPQHQGAAVPTLAPNYVVIRGGTIKFGFVVGTTQTDDIVARYQLIYPKQQLTRYNSLVQTNMPIVDWLAAIPTPQNDEWKLQDAGDYSEFFHPPVMDKTIVLKPGDFNETFHKLKITRFDADDFTYGRSFFPYLVVYAKNAANNAAVTLGIRTSYNLSFVIMDI